MYYRVQTISDIISTQINWNRSKDFTNEPIELLFEVPEVSMLILNNRCICENEFKFYISRFKTTQTTTFHVLFGTLMLILYCKFYLMMLMYIIPFHCTCI